LHPRGETRKKLQAGDKGKLAYFAGGKIKEDSPSQANSKK
jgi:hypothetical protein